MANIHCPGCGSRNVVQRKVNECMRAADPVGRVFELSLQLPIWRCLDCKWGWRGQEAEAAIESAYQSALDNNVQRQSTA